MSESMYPVGTTVLFSDADYVVCTGQVCGYSHGLYVIDDGVSECVVSHEKVRLFTNINDHYLSPW